MSLGLFSCEKKPIRHRQHYTSFCGLRLLILATEKNRTERNNLTVWTEIENTSPACPAVFLNPWDTMAEVISSGSGDSGTRENREGKTVNSGIDGNRNGNDDDRKEGTVQQKVQKLGMNPTPGAVLIVMERWGSPIHCAITAALYLLVGLLKTWGHVIHCTVLEADGNTVREAERLGVKLELPHRKPHYDTYKPTSIWLVAHTAFFPKLKEIENLKFVVGFGLTTASIALDMKDSALSMAKFILVNIWNPEELTHDILKLNKEVFERQRDLLAEQHKSADIVISIGLKTFSHFKYMHGNKIKYHLLLLPFPEISLFELPCRTVMPDDSCHFRILSVFEESVVSELSHTDIIPSAMNLMADIFDKNKEEPPKWIILCAQKHDDKEIKSRIQQHRKLTVLVRGLTNETLNEEICSSNLLILPPRAINSFKFSIDAIACGKPIIVPVKSEEDYFIKENFPDNRKHMIFDMRDGSDLLGDRIIQVFKNYAMYVKKASETKDIMKNAVLRKIDAIDSELFDKVTKYMPDSLPNQSTANHHTESSKKEISESTHSSCTSDVNTHHSTSESHGAIGKSLAEQQRSTCSVGVQVSSSYGNAVNGSTMAEVESRLYESERNRPTTEGTGRVLADIHSDLELEKVDEGSLRYVMKCGSLEALEALWSEYISGRLDKTIHSTIITPTLLSKIQAHYLTLDIYIPVQEYLLCKREIPLITGSVTIPSRRRSVASITELKATQQQYVPRHHTVDSLHLNLSSIQTAEGKTRPRLLSRDDFLIKELHHFRTTFTTKHDKVRFDVRLEEGKVGQSRRKRDQLWTDLNTDSDSLYKEEEVMISEFVRLSTHSTQYSSQRKAVLHEAGQKLMMQREFAISEATPVKEKSETGKALFDELSSDVKRVNQGYPVKESVLEVFGKGSMPGQLDETHGIYIKNNGQWVICDGDNHRVQVIDSIKLCCDLILQFHAFPNPFTPLNVTVDEDNDQYFMSDEGNGQVVVSSGQSKILNCFGRKEGIDPTGICLSPDGFIFIGDWKGYVRKYNKSGEHIARTEEGQVSHPFGLIVNKKCIFVSDDGIGRHCVHVLNHQMQSIRDIGKAHLVGPEGLCFDHQQDGIYVCDFSANRVVHFNCDGEFLSYKGQGQLEKPRFIALCKDNPYRLVVTQQYCIKLLYI